MRTDPSITHKSTHGAFEFYVTVTFDDDAPENQRSDPTGVFVKIAKYGSDTALFVDGWAMVTSLALRRGVAWTEIVAMVQSNSSPDSFLRSVVAAVTHCIQTRRGIIGADEPLVTKLLMAEVETT